MKPTNALIDSQIAEFLASRTTQLDRSLGQIEVAIFLEETFGFMLSDGEIDDLTPTDPRKIARVVRKKRDA